MNLEFGIKNNKKVRAANNHHTLVSDEDIKIKVIVVVTVSQKLKIFPELLIAEEINIS